MIQLQNLFKIIDEYEPIIIRSSIGDFIYKGIVYDFKYSKELMKYSNVNVTQIEAINNSTLIILDI